MFEIDEFRYAQASKKNFDYTLGPDAATLVEGIGADAFLIVVATDYVETGGRVALIVLGVLASVVAGAPVGPTMSPTSVILALVEARTGSILWFNQVASGANLRDPQSDAELVDVVMKGLAEE